MHLIHQIIPRKGKLLKAGTSEVLRLLTEAVLIPHAWLCFRELRLNPRLHLLTHLIVPGGHGFRFRLRADQLVQAGKVKWWCFFWRPTNMHVKWRPHPGPKSHLYFSAIDVCESNEAKQAHWAFQRLLRCFSHSVLGLTKVLQKSP